jgi:hypothetical protein
VNATNTQELESWNFGNFANWSVTPCRHLLTADIGGETIILHRTTTRFFSTNEVGTFIWSLLKRAMPLEGIRDAITAEFSGASDECEADLVQFIAALVAEDLVLLAPKSQSPGDES